MSLDRVVALISATGQLTSDSRKCPCQAGLPPRRRDGRLSLEASLLGAAFFLRRAAMASSGTSFPRLNRDPTDWFRRAAPRPALCPERTGRLPRRRDAGARRAARVRSAP